MRDEGASVSSLRFEPSGEECFAEGVRSRADSLREPISGVADVVLVASGKGGVGKSTVTVNLACALQRAGRKVGVLDADLYGPSVACMLGSGEELEVRDDGRAIPACTHDVHSVSAANIVPPEAALAWKGPLVSQALIQLFREVAWPELDLLLVDLPPGTGDVQLTILEQVPVTGAIVVTTPQRLATIDAERAIALFHELGAPVFGLVENMAGYVCPCCGALEPLFGPSAATTVVRDNHVAYLGGIPLDPAAQESADSGTPLVVARPEGDAAAAFYALGEQVLGALARERLAARYAAENPEAGFAFWERLLDD